ncbi:MAG: aminotransferase class IV [Myxococcota bacterium]
MIGKILIDGHLFAPEEARISVLDRGFLYGDSVYEVLRIYDTVPFAFGEHLVRLYSSGERIGFALPWSAAELRTATERTLEAAGLRDAYLRIVATRGSGPVGLDPTLATAPQLIIMVLGLPPLPEQLYIDGRSAALVSVQRNLKRALDPLAKTGNYMNNVLAVQEAKGRGADEAIMLDHHGRVAEGGSANVFARIGDSWCTPPLEVGILSGITRATLLELCERDGIPAAERVLWPDDLRGASEVFVCSSVRGLMPIVRLDDEPVADGRRGPATKHLQEIYATEVSRRTRAWELPS